MIGFPPTIYGSHKAVGLDESLSFDRYTRYGAYGFGEDEKNVENWIRPTKVDWNNVDWGKLQKQCAADNADRFDAQSQGPNTQIAPEARTAVLIRSYTGKEYSDNDIINIRAMVAELSLQSGGEYEVVLLTHVKDDSIRLDDPLVWDRLLQEHIPREFWRMTQFWNMPQEVAHYPQLDPELMELEYPIALRVDLFLLTLCAVFIIRNGSQCNNSRSRTLNLNISGTGKSTPASQVTTMNSPTELQTSARDSHVEESGSAVNDSTSQIIMAITTPDSDHLSMPRVDSAFGARCP